MPTGQIEVEIPEKLQREIDAAVGPENRRDFIIRAAETELRQRRLLRFLESDEAVWKEEDHPEWVGGSAAWVRALRQENEKRVPRPEPESSAA